MGLFFIAVGMSIDVGALLRDWAALLVHVPVVLILKGAVLIGLVLAFGISRSAAIRTGFYLSQVGEFAFVLLGAAAIAGLLSADGHTVAMLVVAVSMILTPLMVKAGDQLAGRLQAIPASAEATPAADLDRHVVIVGYDEVGQLIDLMLEKANIPHVAFDRDISVVRQGKRSGRNVHFGDMYSATTQEAAGLGKAAAVYVTSRDMDHAKALAVTLHRLYPHLDVYVRVRTLADQDGVGRQGHQACGHGLHREHAGSREHASEGSWSCPRTTSSELVKELQQNDYALIRAAYAEVEKQ